VAARLDQDDRSVHPRRLDRRSDSAGTGTHDHDVEAGISSDGTGGASTTSAGAGVSIRRERPWASRLRAASLKRREDEQKRSIRTHTHLLPAIKHVRCRCNVAIAVGCVTAMRPARLTARRPTPNSSPKSGGRVDDPDTGDLSAIHFSM
jgi:hypothetical protein